MTHYEGSVPVYEQAADWRSRAACRETDRNGKPVHDPELFFPVGNTGPALLQIEEAKAVCRRCPVIDECLSWALDTGQDSGVWGGLSEDERCARKRRRARGISDTPKERPALPATVQELWNRHAKPLGDGHYAWAGPVPGRTTGHTYTPMQAAFVIDRGHMPLSRLVRTCEVKDCVRHIQDTGETRCGTRPGYRKHLQEGTEPCTSCRQANADADRRLAWTGTTKVTPDQPKRGRGRPPGPSGPRAECGTARGYYQHRNYGEPIDDACRAANTRACAEYRKRVAEKKATA